MNLSESGLIRRSLAGHAEDVQRASLTGVAEDDLTVEVESRKRSRETLPGSGMKRSHTCSDLTDVKRIPALPLQRSGLSGNMDDLMSMWTFDDVGERAARRQRCKSPFTISNGREADVTPDTTSPSTISECLKPCWAVRNSDNLLADRVSV